MSPPDERFCPPEMAGVCDGCLVFKAQCSPVYAAGLTFYPSWLCRLCRLKARVVRWLVRR